MEESRRYIPPDRRKPMQFDLSGYGEVDEQQTCWRSSEKLTIQGIDFELKSGLMLGTDGRTFIIRIQLIDLSKPGQTAAEFNVLLTNDINKFNHREVQEEYRGRGLGLGSLVLTKLESEIEHQANYRNEAIVVKLQLGQPEVWEWFQRKGYVLDKDDIELAKEIADHPERFETKRAVAEDRMKYMFRIKDGRSVRLNFTKIIS